MCGIFGYIGHIEKNLAIKCTNKLSHRGPDGSGLFHQNDVCLGHRRLAILDLSEAGRQPMPYAKERYWITFNGEIYNFIEIKKELESKNYKFNSSSDTEVILASFIEWREKCLNKFNGMWALAIWDNENKELFLSRDRFGKKPLFYSQLNDDFIFASEMKAITPLLKKIEPNLELIKNTKFTNYESTDQCLIKKIKRFPAGHFGFYRNKKLTIERYWCTLDHLRPVPQKYEDQITEFRDLFINACAIRMRSDVPIGTALSGGLDSSSVVSTLSHIKTLGLSDRINKNWQNAFVASFPDTPIDETYYAALAANHIGIKPKIIIIDPLKYINKLNEYLYLFEEIYNTSPIPFVALYGAMRKNNVVVTLDGHGPDEVFGGYGFDIMTALNNTNLNLYWAKQLLNAYYNIQPQNKEQFKRLPPKILYYVKFLLKKIFYNSRRDCSPASRDREHDKWNALDPLTKILYISTHETILPTLLRNYDRYSMINGVEIRMPFMDHRIISYAFSLPLEAKIRHGYTKAIIRDSLACFMPREIAYRQSKIGFNSPIVDWLRGPLKSYFMDLINSKLFKESDIIDYSETAEKIKKVINDDKATFAMGVEAWSALSPYLWEQSFLKRIKEKTL